MSCEEIEYDVAIGDHPLNLTQPLIDGFIDELENNLKNMVKTLSEMEPQVFKDPKVSLTLNNYKYTLENLQAISHRYQLNTKLKNKYNLDIDGIFELFGGISKAKDVLDKIDEDYIPLEIINITHSQMEPILREDLKSAIKIATYEIQ